MGQDSGSQQGSPTRGRVVIVSGPSGVGKGTVLKEVYRRRPVPLVPSVSATTRPPRPGEEDGVHYHFLSEEEFARRREAGEFLECFQVFQSGRWYGTLRATVEETIGRGEWIVLEIDVQGASAVMREYPDAVSFFIRTDTLEELERRLRGRGTESEEAIRHRLDEARSELALADRYRYQVVNDDLQRAADEIARILVES